MFSRKRGDNFGAYEQTNSMSWRYEIMLFRERHWIGMSSCYRARKTACALEKGLQRAVRTTVRGTCHMWHIICPYPWKCQLPLWTLPLSSPGLCYPRQQPWAWWRQGLPAWGERDVGERHLDSVPSGLLWTTYVQEATFKAMDLLSTLDYKLSTKGPLPFIYTLV